MPKKLATGPSTSGPAQFQAPLKLKCVFDMPWQASGKRPLTSPVLSALPKAPE